MNYTPGTIVTLIGVGLLVASLFAKTPEEKASRIRSGLIDIGIGVVLFLIFGVFFRG